MDEFLDNILPKEIVLSVLHSIVDAAIPDQILADIGKEQMRGLVKYDVRAHKICTTCKEANELWGAKHGCDADGPCVSTAFASEVMPYCVEGSFAYDKPISGLLLEPVDSFKKEPVSGKLAVSTMAPN